MKKLALGLAGVLVVALATAVAKSLSSEAMAVIVGIVCGIGASIPTSLVMLYLLSRQEQDEEKREQQRHGQPQGGRQTIIYSYGPLAIGPDARVAQIGAPQPYRPGDFRHPQYMPDFVVPGWTTPQLPGGEE